MPDEALDSSMEAKKKGRKQEQHLNNIGEQRWKRLGSFAFWQAYTVRQGRESEIIPVRKNISRFELASIVSRARKLLREDAIKRKKEELRKKKARKKRVKK